MQNLYMMAVLIREQQLAEMANQITIGFMSIEQAMSNYNVTTKEAVVEKIEILKRKNQHAAAKNHSDTLNLNVQAA